MTQAKRDEKSSRKYKVKQKSCNGNRIAVLHVCLFTGCKYSYIQRGEQTENNLYAAFLFVVIQSDIFVCLCVRAMSVLTAPDIV